MHNRTDLELIQQIQLGDDTAFEELYRRYERKVYYTAFSIMRTEADAQDVVQATFIQVYKSIKDLRKPDYFLLWLNRITCHKCKDLFRKLNRSITIDVEQEQVKNQYIDEHLDYNPSNHMKFQSDKELIHHLIKELPYLQREAIVLCYFQNLSMQEIADVLEEPVGTVKSRLFLARKQLKKRIKSYEARNQLPLNFHSTSLETVLISYFSMLPSSSLTSSVSITSHVSLWKHFFGSTFGKVALAVSLAGGSLTVVHSLRDTDVYHKPVIAHNSNITTIQYEGSVIENERFAYFTLLHWAASSQQISSRSNAEAEKIQPVYDYLKNKGGQYWEYLEERGWNISYESTFM